MIELKHLRDIKNVIFMINGSHTYKDQSRYKKENHSLTIKFY